MCCCNRLVHRCPSHVGQLLKAYMLILFHDCTTIRIALMWGSCLPRARNHDHGNADETGEKQTVFYSHMPISRHTVAQPIDHTKYMVSLKTRPKRAKSELGRQRTRFFGHFKIRRTVFGGMGWNFDPRFLVRSRKS